jgi:cytochrome c-type protein NapB
MRRRWAVVCSAVVVAGLFTGCGSPASEAWAERSQPRRELSRIRDERRLYDGAPPVIPHDVAPLGRENCRNCHAPGSYQNGERIASPRSHPAWGDCRQCHIGRHTTAVFRQSAFTPLRWPATGHRQTAIAPPMIPHHIQNREQCAVCHIGAQAHPALRAKHGLRSQCRQCHLAGAGGGRSE